MDGSPKLNPSTCKAAAFLMESINRVIITEIYTTFAEAGKNSFQGLPSIRASESARCEVNIIRK